MKHLLVPKPPIQMSIDDDPNHWAEVSEESLDGCFYDHITDCTGVVLGVRYWVDETVVFECHPVFKNFIADKRFKFHQQSHHVDIVFEARAADALQNGLLEIRTVQDFGGETVVRKGDAFGIVFNLG